MKYEHLLGILVTGIIIGLAYSVKAGRPYLAVGILFLGVLLVQALDWYYNSKIERIEDERTELISAKSAKNSYAVMSFLLFAEYIWEYSHGNMEIAVKLLILLGLGSVVLLISQYHYGRVM